MDLPTASNDLYISSPTTTMISVRHLFIYLPVPVQHSDDITIYLSTPHPHDGVSEGTKILGTNSFDRRQEMSLFIIEIDVEEGGIGIKEANGPLGTVEIVLEFVGTKAHEIDPTGRAAV